jgi:nitric oxide reductase large subunit
VLRDPQRWHLITAFFLWAAWACAANWPGETISYTRNWPPEPLVGNVPTGSTLIWSVVSFFLLLSELPRGLMQTVASVNKGMWWARSADFMQQGIGRRSAGCG